MTWEAPPSMWVAPSGGFLSARLLPHYLWCGCDRPSSMLEPPSLGFHSGLTTSSAARILQAFSIRWRLKKPPASWTEQPPDSCPPWCETAIVGLLRLQHPASQSNKSPFNIYPFYQFCSFGEVWLMTSAWVQEKKKKQFLHTLVTESILPIF